MRVRVLAVLVLAAAALLARPAMAQSKLKVEKLADGVWAATPEKGANVGWFLLGDGVVAVDSGGDVAAGAEILKAIAETTGGKPVRALVLTHEHADHSGGARAFAAAGARIVCQEAVAGPLFTFLTQGSDAKAPTASRPVLEAVSERSILFDGVHNVQIYFLGAAHTKGDLVVYLATDKILFSGDLITNGRLPYMQSTDVDPMGWERALLALSQVGVEKIVPGHGDIGPKSGLNESLAYLHAVNGLVKKFITSGTADAALDAAIRSPENEIKGVPVTDGHVANVKAAVKAEREKASRKAASPTPAPTPAPK